MPLERACVIVKTSGNDGSTAGHGLLEDTFR
jgi:hypothetical protein